jgi:CRISPR-associated exonuclease Cas4
VVAPLTLLAVAGVAVGALAVAVGARALTVRRREGRYGTLVGVDARPGSGATLRSERYRISGRPDELRRQRDGRLVPVEVKSRGSPVRGPPYSHRVQVWAYCLLVEEATGRAPPYGVLRYSDGGEFRVAWDRGARAELLALRTEVGRPYDGRATPTPAKCAGCRWRNGCDARAG